jgi:hypothetical protein
VWSFRWDAARSGDAGGPHHLLLHTVKAAALE